MAKQTLRVHLQPGTYKGEKSGRIYTVLYSPQWVKLHVEGDLSPDAKPLSGAAEDSAQKAAQPGS